MEKKKYWDFYWSRDKDSGVELYLDEEFVEDVLENSSKHFNKNGRILDLGCGSGVYMNKLRKNGFKTVGLDISSEVLKDLNSSVCGVSEELPFKDESFDVVFCVTVFEYITDRRRAMQEIRRVLKEDGKAIIIVPNSLSLSIGFAWGFVLPILGVFNKRFKQPYYRFRKKEFLSMIEGFDILENRYLPITYLLMPGFLRAFMKCISMLFREEVFLVLKKI